MKIGDVKLGQFYEYQTYVNALQQGEQVEVLEIGVPLKRHPFPGVLVRSKEQPRPFAVPARNLVRTWSESAKLYEHKAAMQRETARSKSKYARLRMDLELAAHDLGIQFSPVRSNEYGIYLSLKGKGTIKALIAALKAAYALQKGDQE